ncbi:MAG: hypothetical protein E2579_26070 [Pseudomonas sp.]|uniref:lysogeny maintenance protein PflM n=1 Tax=Ectopseudomonas guguanensis TaxID=1198456 RepID=UPI0012D52437|nr:MULTISPECIES: DUF5447 family protein [Pseudomonas]MPT21163.1 hypothetical protein [Pseudomonas sp.]WJH57873.1 hypothetical protein FE254_17700 [Pseudomonas guguanensis]
MKSLSQYLRQPHVESCDCSVCWTKRQVPIVQSLWQLCNHCHPGHVSTVNGRLYVVPPSYCATHKPGARPPRYWYVVSNIGKPTPFVPLREPFEQGELL